MLALLKVAFTFGVMTIFGRSRDQNTKPYKLTQLTSFLVETNAKGKSAFRSEICSMDLLRFVFQKKL